MFGRYFLNRLSGSLIAIIGVSILIFGLARILPGDPARVALGPSATNEQIAQLRHELHLDAPLPAQYWDFIEGLAHGDLGISLYTNRSVVADLRQYFPATLELVIVAGLIMALIGIPLGIVGARFRNKWPDDTARLVGLLGVVTPSFVWAIVLMLIFGYWLGWMPIVGRLSHTLTPPYTITGFYTLDALLEGNMAVFWNALWHLVLPAVALALAGLGQASRLTRTNMVESYERQYVELARSFGFTELIIAIKYALRPAMIPTITVMGLDLASMLGNAFLVEIVFNWPGLGRYGVEAALHKDLNAIIGVVLIIAAFFLIVNLLVDFAVALLSPRLRLQGASS
jgi:peptide/nickel transport system permease protein